MRVLLFVYLMCLPLFSQSWQTSAAPQVRLGVRDKYGDRDYEATFIVTGADSKSYTAKVTASGEFGYVNFPDDFDTYASPQTYKWECYVGGKKVEDGVFQYATKDTYSDALFIPQK